ncbi:MAG: Wzz/FepE/Etk N-terminal domain-containing protein [Candidatus Krumholzibacteriales bacterium]
MDTRRIEHKESTLKDFIEVLFRRKWMILAIVLFATITVIYMNMREPAVYESISTVLLKRAQPQSVFATYSRQLPWEEDVSSQIELAKSQMILDKAQKNLSGYLPEGYDTIPRIKPGSVSSGVVSTSNVIWIKYTSGDPVLCEAAVEAITNTFRDYYSEARTPPEMEDFFSSELQMIMEEIEYWRDRKDNLEKKWGLVDVEMQRQSLINRMDVYVAEREELSRKRNKLKGVIGKLIEASEESNIEDMYILYDDYLGSRTRGSSLDSMNEKLGELKMSEIELSARYTDNNEQLIEIREKLEELREMMMEEFNSIIAVKKMELEVIEEEERMLSELIEGLAMKSSHGSEVERINSALSRLKASYEDVNNKQLDARVSMASNPEWKVTVLTSATPPSRQRTKDYVRIALGPLFSILFAVGFAFFVDNLDHSIKNVSEAEEALEMTVLASFPDTEKK